MTKPILKMSAKISPMVLALALAFPLAANAANKPVPKPTTEQLQAEIDLLKTQLAELKKMVMEKAATPAPVIVQKLKCAAMRTLIENISWVDDAGYFEALHP